MKKIVPIITLCLAIATAALNLIALICAFVSLSAPNVKLISIPTAIAGFVAAATLTPFAFLFKKDILCKISTYIDLASFVLAIVAVAVAFSVL
ncbi:MAG: hypothetical protein K2M47_05760 [Clostridiales bacterium]|nr:hypothetical protein [Clostridiales bacterium]